MPISLYLPYLLVAWAAYLIAVASPGPAVVALINTSMTRGRKAGMSFATGIMAGSLVWATLSAVGLSAVIATYAELLIVIRIAGGLYLLYLAYRAFRAAASAGDAMKVSGSMARESVGRLYFKGFLLHVTNPKAIFVWISMVSLALPVGAPASIIVIFILGCQVIGLVTLNLMALMFSASSVVRLYGKARRYIEASMGAFFAFAGVKLLLMRV